VVPDSLVSVNDARFVVAFQPSDTVILLARIKFIIDQSLPLVAESNLKPS
jgi:hypothetical protein